MKINVEIDRHAHNRHQRAMRSLLKELDSRAASISKTQAAVSVIERARYHAEAARYYSDLIEKARDAR
jgi:hypothetical protein